MKAGDLVYVTGCRDVGRNRRHEPFWALVVFTETPYRFHVVGLDIGEGMYFEIDTGDVYCPAKQAPAPPPDNVLAAQAAYHLSNGRNF